MSRKTIIILICLSLLLGAACSGPVAHRTGHGTAGIIWPLSWKKWKKKNRSVRALARTIEGRPAWTCTLPPHQGLLALGYSMPWVYPGDTLLHACKRGLDHLTRSVLSRVRTESAVLTWQYWEHGWFDKEVEVSRGQEAVVAGRALVVDNWLDPDTGAGWCLVGLPGAAQAGGPVISPGVEEGEFCAARPAWIDDPPTEQGTLFAVGISRAWAEEWRGTENAEDEALAELSRVLSSRAEGSLLRISKGDQTGIHQIRKLVSHAVLVGSQIIAWWRDPANGDWYTLARLPMTPVKITLVTRVSALNSEGTSNEVEGESLMEKAERHHRRMEEVLDAMDW